MKHITQTPTSLIQDTVEVQNGIFAQLCGEEDGYYIYKFSYTIDTTNALNAGILGVRISVLPSNPPLPQSMFAQNIVEKKVSKEKLPLNIQQSFAIAKDAKKSVINSVISQKNSDFTNKVSNANILSPNNKTNFKLASVENLSQLDKNEPVLAKTVYSPVATEKTFKDLSVKAILQEKKDPSNLETNFSNSDEQAFGGIAAIKPLVASKAQSTIVLKSLQSQNNTKTNELLGSEVVNIVSKETTSKVKVSKDFRLEKTKIDNIGEFIVRFELRNALGIAVKKIDKKVNHPKLLQIFETPTIPPKVTNFGLRKVGRNTLAIKQEDPIATSVDIFRRDFKSTRRLEDLNYIFIGSAQVGKKDGEVLFDDFQGNGSDVIYRVVPVGPKQQRGSVFSSVVTPAVRFKTQSRIDKKLEYAGVVAKIVQGGVQVDVVSIPPGVSSVRVGVRDLTIREIKPRFLGDLLNNRITLRVNNQSTSYSFLDPAAKMGHVYEYCAYLLYSNGDTVIANGCDFIEYIPFSSGVVETFLSQPQISRTAGGIDVRFDVQSKLIDKDKTALKKLIESQGLSNLFLSELENEKTTLNNLVAHSIRRVNLTTGESEFFRTFTDQTFSDVSNQKISSVSPLRSGHKYKYIVTSLLRSAETLFENNEKTIIKTGNNVEVKVLPLKYLHPITKNKGNLVTPLSLKTNHSKEPFEFGRVGNFVEQNVIIDLGKPKIANVSVSRFNNETNIISWSVLGDRDEVDHFLIVAERTGKQEIIGKTHSSFKSNKIRYIDKKEPKKRGAVRYKIIPVLKNFERGPAAFSERVVI